MALVDDAADRLTSKERAAFDGFLNDPLGAGAFDAAKSLLDEIEVVDRAPVKSFDVGNDS